MDFIQRKKDCQELLGRVEKRPVDDTPFQALFADALDFLETSDSVVGDALRVSRPTVHRWRTGKSLPHRGMREPVLRYLQKQLRRRERFLLLRLEEHKHEAQGLSHP